MKNVRIKINNEDEYNKIKDFARKNNFISSMCKYEELKRKTDIIQLMITGRSIHWCKVCESGCDNLKECSSHKLKLITIEKFLRSK